MNIDSIIDPRYYKMLKWFRVYHEDMLPRYLDSISQHQIEDKTWLVENASMTLKHSVEYWKEKAITIEIIGGWFGFPLIHILHEHLNIPIKLIRLVEPDPFCGKVLHKYKEIFDLPFEIKWIKEDINDLVPNNETRSIRLVINTSCEHMNNMSEIIEKRGYIPDKSFFALQSNDSFDDPEHINCVNSPEELRNQAKIVSSRLKTKKSGSFNRFLVFGRYSPQINFFTLKWGDKYGPEYVNRLYGSLKQQIKHYEPVLTCITDDSTGIRPEVKIVDYDTFDPFDYPKDRIFTREKAVIKKKYNKGQNFILDLDILIQSDITDVVTCKMSKPKMIWNYWNWKDKTDVERYQWYGKGTDCYCNSSFVGWTDTVGEFVYDHIEKYEEEAFHTYKSYDKYLYYQHIRHDRLDFWDEDFVCNYNFDETFKYEKQPQFSICLFNTSHLAKNKIKTEHQVLELDETDGWAKYLWESYDN